MTRIRRISERKGGMDMIRCYAEKSKDGIFRKELTLSNKHQITPERRSESYDKYVGVP